MAAEIAETKKQDAAVETRIQASDREVQRTRQNLVRTAAEISRIEREKEKLTVQIRNLEKKRKELVKKITDTTAHLGNATAAIVAIGRAGAGFSASTASEHAIMMALLGAISEQFDRDMKLAGQQLSELEKLQRDLTRRLESFAAAQRRHQREHASLDKLLQSRSTQNAELRGRQHELRQQITTLTARAQNLSELATSVTPRIITGTSRGKMVFPADGAITTGFNVRRSGVRSDGWFVRTRPAAVVVAPADGRIEYVDSFRGHNRVVIIGHGGGYLTVLTGMNATNVLLGQEVLGGEPIGRMSEQGGEIYVELRRNGIAINPNRRFNEPR